MILKFKIQRFAQNLLFIDAAFLLLIWGICLCLIWHLMRQIVGVERSRALEGGAKYSRAVIVAGKANVSTLRPIVEWNGYVSIQKSS